MFDMRPVEQGAAGDECDGATDERPSQVQYEAIEVVVYRLRKKLVDTPARLVTGLITERGLVPADEAALRRLTGPLR